MKEKSADAIVFRRNNKIKYILLHYHYKKTFWDFPKGNVEKGEKELETVKREIQEETGIKSIKFVPDFKEKLSYVYNNDGKIVFKDVILYLVETMEKVIPLSDQLIC